MPTLVHYPLCPLSRFVRLILAEYGISTELAEERVWERREAFLQLNPAGTTPVYLPTEGPPVPHAGIIAEFLDETCGLAFGDRRLLPEQPAPRIEVRRLVAWFNEKFYAEVADPLVHEKVMKVFMAREQGGGAPDTASIRAAKNNVRYHLHYVGWLLQTRKWLAGDRMSYADLAAAAQFSVVDYLGDVPWAESEQATSWYATMKSRPSFRTLLEETVLGVAPSRHYANLDF